jgi:hypothetical protein
MADKRMFSKAVCRTDYFLDMPLSAQALYFHLSLDADVKGFVAPGFIMRLTRAQPDDLNVLIAKGFIIPFESGVLVVTHWNLHNQLREDREAPSQFVKELQSLEILPSKVYKSTARKRVTIANSNSGSTPGLLLPRLEEIRGVSNGPGAGPTVSPFKDGLSTQTREAWDYWEEKFSEITTKQEDNRAALNKLLQLEGSLDKVKKLIDLASRSWTEDYVPRDVKPSSPDQLWKKRGALLAWGKKFYNADRKF